MNSCPKPQNKTRVEAKQEPKCRDFLPSFSLCSWVPSPWPQLASAHLNLLEGVGNHGNEHVQQHNDHDDGKDAIEGPAHEFRHQKLRHVDDAVLLHAEHGPEQKLECLVETGNMRPSKG